MNKLIYEHMAKNRDMNNCQNIRPSTYTHVFSFIHFEHFKFCTFAFCSFISVSPYFVQFLRLLISTHYHVTYIVSILMY